MVNYDLIKKKLISLFFIFIEEHIKNVLVVAAARGIVKNVLIETIFIPLFWL